MVCSVLDYQSLPLTTRTQCVQTVILEEENVTFSRSVHNAENVNSAIEYSIQVCQECDAPLRVLLGLFCQVASEPIFDQLRTKEQLGYMVFSGQRKQQMLSFRIIVQSEKDPVFIESRIDAFLLIFQVLNSHLGAA